MKSNLGVAFLVLGALIAIGTAVAHTSCIYFGPGCYATQMAPDFVVESAENGTYLAPVAAIFASIIFVVFGLYALSAAGIIRKLPLLKFAIYTIAIISIIRGLLPLQFWLRNPDKISDYAFYAGIVWLVAGLLYLFGYRMSDNQH